MGATARRSIALAVTGLGLGGLTLLASGAAEAATHTAVPAAGRTAAAEPVCRYTVHARHGVHVRLTPRGKILGTLPNGKIVFADRCHSAHGWAQLHGGVKPAWVKKYVARSYLARY
ncbi:hypothetical protein [Actinomadura gamaensis]|uniref:SH3 domain-containing protein n=1 Tax=Actinomadura gamaensis TaxID=1763541 RepID=A0ABV9U4A1_9ACTN